MHCKLSSFLCHQGVEGARKFSRTSFSVQFSSVIQLCPTLCDPMNYSMPGLPIHHQLPEFTQIHVHRVDDAIQPSHPLSSPAPPVLRMRWPKYWSFSFRISPSNEHPGLISFRMDCKEIQPVHRKGDQSWVFIGRTDAEAKPPILWPPHEKS